MAIYHGCERGKRESHRNDPGLLSVARLTPAVPIVTRSRSVPWRMTMTSKPPAVIQALIDAHINAFNTQDNDLFLSVFGDTAIIIDGIAPYRWLNPHAPANWLKDVAQWRADLG